MVPLFRAMAPGDDVVSAAQAGSLDLWIGLWIRNETK